MKTKVLISCAVTAQLIWAFVFAYSKRRFSHDVDHFSLVMRKLAFCICENKDADQLHSNREANQPLCFRYTESTIPLLPKSEISSLQPSSVAVQPGLCRTWSETPKTRFLTTRLIYNKLTLFVIQIVSTSASKNS